MNQQIPLSFKSIDAGNKNDRSYTDPSVDIQDRLSNDLQHDNLLPRSRTRSDQSKLNREETDDFLLSNNANNKNKTNNNQQKPNLSKPLSNKKQKHATKSHHLQFLIDKINQLQLTKHHIIMIILNILMILILLIVYQVLKRSSRNVLKDIDEVLVMKRGNIFGGPGGEILWDDAETATLTFNDTISRVTASQSFDLSGESVLLSLTFSYSNDRTAKEYGGIGRSGRWEDLNMLELISGEHINQITIYEGYRNITNLWRVGKLTYIIVGIYFKTNYNRDILYGSKNGIQKTESHKNYFLGYTQGKFGGYIDSLRFTWYKYSPKKSTIMEEND